MSQENLIQELKEFNHYYDLLTKSREVIQDAEADKIETKQLKLALENKEKINEKINDLQKILNEKQSNLKYCKENSLKISLKNEIYDIENQIKENKQMVEDFNKEDIMKKIKELEGIIDKEKNQRKIEKWFPNKLLCRRFGVKPPHDGKYTSEQNEEKESNFDKEILPLFKEKNRKRKNESENENDNSKNENIEKKRKWDQKEEKSLGLRNKFVSSAVLEGDTEKKIEKIEIEKIFEEKTEEKIEEKKPPIELFKSIFDDDSD